MARRAVPTLGFHSSHEEGGVHRVRGIQSRAACTAYDGDEFVGGALFGPDTRAVHSDDSNVTKVIVAARTVELEIVLPHREIGDQHIITTAGD